jgi:hypothetical protein
VEGGTVKIEVDIAARHTWLQTLLEQRAEQIAKERTVAKGTFKKWKIDLDTVPDVHQQDFLFCVVDDDPYGEGGHEFVLVSFQEVLASMGFYVYGVSLSTGKQ